MDNLNLARYFSDFLSKCGAEDVEIIEVKDGNVFNYLVVCTAFDKYFAQDLLIELLEYAKDQFNLVNLGLEGYKRADWVIVDFGKVFVHIFQPNARKKARTDMKGHTLCH